LQEEGQTPGANGLLDVFVVSGEDDRVDALRALAELRAAGLAADVDYAGRSQNAQIKHANRLGTRFVVILTGDKATVRERGREDREVGRDQLTSELRS
jgi:histidyl-tRNA synthetase